MVDFNRSSMDLDLSLQRPPVREIVGGIPTVLSSVAFSALNLGLDTVYFVGTRTPKFVHGARERIKTGVNAAAGGFLALTGAEYSAPQDLFVAPHTPYELLPDTGTFQAVTPSTPSVVQLQQREIGR